MSAAGAAKHALALAVRACRRALSAALPTRPAPALARDLFRAVVQRHVAVHGIALDAEEIPWLFPAPAALPPAATEILARFLDAPDLNSVWIDASVLGWVYQFWSDESREAIDARIGARGRVSPEEIAEKTQLFTERYMVDWLLENSLGAAARALAERRRARLGLSPCPPATASAGYFVPGARFEEEDELPARLRDLKLLDPACGSGHFLVGAFDLLVPLYRAEARDEGRALTDAAIAHEILAHNLHGVDIDAEAVRITATVLLLSAKRLASPEPFRAPPLALLGLGFDEGALLAATRSEALAAHDPTRVGEALACLRDWRFRGSLTKPPGAALPDATRAAIEALLASGGVAEDLGIRGAEPVPSLPARLERLLEGGHYDVVVANPPYLATAKIDAPKARLTQVFGELPDLFAAFVDRSLALCKPRGRCAFVAPSNWLFLSTFAPLRARVLAGELLLVADLGKGAFRHASKLIQTSMFVTAPQAPVDRARRSSWGARVGNQATSDELQPERLALALRDPRVFTPFDPGACAAIAGAPLLFWLDPRFLERYRDAEKIEDVATGAAGTATGDNERFLRAVWEIAPSEARAAVVGESDTYVPYLKGADGEAFFEPFRWVLRVPQGGLALRLNGATFELPVPSALGVAYTTIGHRFAARQHTVASVRDVSGASFYPRGDVSLDELLCALNRTPVRELAHALNPSINFQQMDVRRLPFERHPRAAAIVGALRASFDQEQRTRETSLSFTGPGPSSWQATQSWAQRAIDDLAFDEPAPMLAARSPAEDAAAHTSAALGLVLGRFARGDDGLRLADPAEKLGLPFLFLDAAGGDDRDGPATAALHEAWARHAASFPEAIQRAGLGAYLREHAFDHHLRTHDGRPAYLPLASRRRSIVVFVWAQRFEAGTLQLILTTRLEPLLRAARKPPLDRAAKARLQELSTFVEDVRALVEHGPASPERPTEQALPFLPFVEDGVRVLAASLWSLVRPLWKEPQADWLTLAAPTGKRGFDWSRTAARYFPTRVERAVRADASLAAEHGRLRAFHPAVASRWETKLTKSPGRNAGAR